MRSRLPSPIALVMLLLVCAISTRGIAQSQAKASEPITGILGAFKTRQIVGIPDAHRNTGIHTFLLSLIRDPRFPTVVNDVVVECGNARHQDVADRFVRGEDVPYETLQKIWLDTTQAQPGCDSPQPEETLRTVRAVNASLRREQQIRVLLGDPPIPWEEVTTKVDHRKWIGMREIFPAEVVQREVVAKKRKALLVYGVVVPGVKDHEATKPTGRSSCSRAATQALRAAFRHLDNGDPDSGCTRGPTVPLIAAIAVPAKCRRSALGDGAEHAPILAGHPGAV